MSRVRTAAIASIVMVFAVLLLSVAARSIVLSGFAETEREAATSNVERAGAALAARLASLPVIAKDWGNWDDTFRFLSGEYEGYEATNLTPESIHNLAVTHMLYFDDERRLHHASAVDPESAELVPVEPAIVEAARQASPLFDLPQIDSTASGVIEVAGSLYLAGSANITNSALSEQPRGTLVILTRLGDALISELSEQTRLDVALVDGPGADELREQTSALGATESSGLAELREVDSANMVGIWPVRDMEGRTVAALRVAMRRSIWTQGLWVAHWLTVAIALFGVVAVVAVLGIVDRRVLASSRSALEHAVAERTRELVTSEARFRDLVDHMAQGLLALDEGGRVTFANREAERLFGVESGGLGGRRAGELFLEDNVERRLVGDEARVSSVDASIERYGAPVPVEIVATGTGEGAAGQWLVRDVTMQRRYENQLVHLASHDHLTGLANRRRFEEELEREVARAERTGHGGGILWLDLDDFKEVNDSLGHRAGDELLVGVSNFLLSSTRASGVVARIGGDEFAVLVPEASVAEVDATAERLLHDMSEQRFEISGHRLAVSASVGSVIYPDHGGSVEELLSRADVAMYAAKERGAGAHSRWAPGSPDDASSRTRLEWSERIRHAVENDTVVVYAQPIAHSETGDVASHELLMRLPGDEPGHLIMPGDFLPAAERLGLVRDLDRWMVLNAIRLVARRPDLGVVHVNLSGRAFGDTNLLDLIEAEFELTGADPSHIGFEITETAAIADIRTARQLIGGLRRLGCGLSLDDFGSGFSSFYYLRNLPIDCLKIDGAFVTQLKTSDEDRHLVRAIVELAKALGLDTVAEYVEDEETLQLVREMGITFAQGYHVGRPAPLDEVGS